MKKITLLLIVMSFTFASFSQNFNVPKNYKLEKEEDYALLEKDIINAIDWLYETPSNEQVKKRKEVNSFVMQWITGVSYVHLEMNTNIITFAGGSNPDLLMMFLNGWTKYSIESQQYDDKINGTLAGMEMAIGFYEKNKKNLSKDTELEKYIKMKKNGTLLKYIEENVKE